MLKLLFDPSNKPLKILCFGAHSDDIEIGAGGTILKLIETYAIESVFWIIFCSDEVRKKEAENSAEQFLSSVKEKHIYVKSYRDGFLPYLATEIKEFFERIKREYSPDLVFTHYRNDLHQDHRKSMNSPGILPESFNTRI